MPRKLQPVGAADIDFMHAFHKEMAAKHNEAPQQTVGPPTVPGDAWLLTQQQKLAKLPEHGVRNRFGLLSGKEEKAHQTLDAYEVGFATQTKTNVTPGKLQGNGRTFGPEQGKETMIKLDSYYVQFGKETHALMLPKKAPKSLAEWQGIRPHVPKEIGAADEEIRIKVQAIRDANVPTPLPAPQVPPDGFMIQFGKDMGEIASDASPIGYGGATPPPPHAFEASGSFIAAAPPVTPDKSEYQGVKPQLGSDSYMTSFAKSIGSFTPSFKSRETGKAPPKEVSL